MYGKAQGVLKITYDRPHLDRGGKAWVLKPTLVQLYPGLELKAALGQLYPVSSQLPWATPGWEVVRKVCQEPVFVVFPWYQALLLPRSSPPPPRVI